MRIPAREGHRFGSTRRVCGPGRTGTGRGSAIFQTRNPRVASGYQTECEKSVSVYNICKVSFIEAKLRMRSEFNSNSLIIALKYCLCTCLTSDRRCRGQDHARHLLAETRARPVNPRVRVRDFRVRVRVDCFVPGPVPVSIPNTCHQSSNVGASFTFQFAGE
jgi:hypothetical protein